MLPLAPAKLAVCHSCRLKHLCAPGSDEAIEFFARHRGHNLELVSPHPAHLFLKRMLGVDLFRVRERQPLPRGLFDPARAQEIFHRLFRVDVDRLGHAGYADNADVKEAFGTVATLTITNANLSTSATAGWKGAARDNSSNKYLDAYYHWRLAAVNTAPANSKLILCTAHGVADDSGTNYSSTGDGTPDGSEGTLTFPDFTANQLACPVLGVIPYPVQNRAINGGPFSMASAFKGTLPAKHLPGALNHSGMTLSVTAVEVRESYATVI